jgi:hypothetical protein
VRERETERDLLHSSLTPPLLTCARARAHTHTQAFSRLNCDLTIFYIFLKCNNMRHFITTITFWSKVIILVVCTLNLSVVTSQLTLPLCLITGDLQTHSLLKIYGKVWPLPILGMIYTDNPPLICSYTFRCWCML